MELAEAIQARRVAVSAASRDTMTRFAELGLQWLQGGSMTMANVDVEDALSKLDAAGLSVLQEMHSSGRAA